MAELGGPPTRAGGSRARWGKMRGQDPLGIINLKRGSQMGKVNKTNNYTEFYYHFFRNILLVGVPLVIVFAIILSLPRSSAAELSQADNLAISIPTSCTLSSLINGEHSKSILNGTYEPGIGQTILTTYCNDKNGYVVYASGFSNNELGNNKLISNINDNTNNYDIVSGTATSGTNSNWAMKLSTSDIDSSIINTNAGTDTPTIEPAYNNQYAIVPTNWTKVASKSSGTVASTTGSSFTTTYAVYASTTQPAGIYNGQVRYLLAHPYVSPTILYMQDVANWKDNLNTHDTVLAIDRRDYKAYWVTKLLDGHIWMAQNLAIDLGEIDTAGNVTPRIFTSEDTDLTDHSLTGAYSQANGYSYNENTGIITWTPSNTAKTINFEGNTVTGWDLNSNVPYSAKKTDSIINTGHTSIGNYYNWTAAIASNDSSTLTSDTKNNISQNPKNSICPKGWRLPTISNQSETVAGSTNEFARLKLLYSSNDWRTSPLYFALSGAVNDTFSALNLYGFYWSSTVSTASNVYQMYFDSSTVYPSRDYYRNRGYSIRCIAR